MNECHLPDSYQVTVSNADTDQSEKFSVKPSNFMTSDGFYEQTISVNVAVSGQPTEIVSILEPENCIGNNTSEPVKSSE